MTAKPTLRLVAEYGQLTRPGAVITPGTGLPLYGREPDYTAYETAAKQEEAVHMLKLLTWPAAAQPKLWHLPYSGITVQESDDALYRFTCYGHAVTLAGRNLMDWGFLDALGKHRVKSIREWNAAMHKPAPAGQICFTSICVEELEG